MKFKKKPVIVDAVQWTGANCQEVLDFIGLEYKEARVDRVYGLMVRFSSKMMLVVKRGAYVIKPENNAVYTLDAETFNELYEPAE